MFRIREMTEDDVSAAARIEQVSFSAPWSVQGFRDALRNPCACCLAAEAAESAGRDRNGAETAPGKYRGAGAGDPFPEEKEIRRPEAGAGEDVPASDRMLFYGELAGYCVLYFAAGEGEIETIAVAEKYRKLGAGDALLSEVKRRMPDLGLEALFLEVRPSNAAALALYRKHGFAEIGRRKNFYRDPEEDAILMSCPAPGDSD